MDGMKKTRAHDVQPVDEFLLQTSDLKIIMTR